MITDEEKKPKVLSTDELLKRFNAQKAGAPGAINEDLDPWGTKTVDIDTMLSGQPSRPKVPEAKPVAEAKTEQDGWENANREIIDQEWDDKNIFEKAGAGWRKGVKYLKGGLQNFTADVMPKIGQIGSTLSGGAYTEDDIIEALSPVKTRAIKNMDEAAAIQGKGLVFETSQFMPQMVGAVAAMAAAPVTGGTSASAVPAMLGMGNIAALSGSVIGNTLYEVDKYAAEKGKDIPESTKWSVALLAGTAEFAAEKIRLGQYLPKGMTSKLLTRFLKEQPQVADDIIKKWAQSRPSMYRKFLELVKTTGTQGGEESIEEFFTQIAQDLTNFLYQNPDDRLNFKEIMTNALSAAKGGFMMGTMLGPISYGSNHASMKMRRKRAGGVNLVQTNDGKVYEVVGGDESDNIYVQDNLGKQLSIKRTDVKDHVYLNTKQMTEVLDGYDKGTQILSQIDQQKQADEIAQADPEQMIRDLGKKYAYNGFNSELPDQNFIKYGEMKDGRKVIIKSTNFATDPANMLVAVVDAENPESKPQMVKGNMINNSMDVPYEEWVQNEMRNYQATMSQISNETAKATAPVQEGATIPIGEQLFNVTQVTDQGITLNEIDKDGNLTANTQVITPDQYGKVFGVGPTENGAPMPQDGVQQPNLTTGQPAAPAQPTEVSQQSRKVSDGKNEFTIIPQEDGNFRMSESFETQKEAETALKKLQERYPKLTWKAEMTDSGDMFTPDTYNIVAEPKKKPAAPMAKKEELTSASLSVKDETTAPSSESTDAAQGNRAMESNNVSSVQSEAIQTRTTEDEVTKSLELTSKSSTDLFEDIIPVTGKSNKGVIETGYNHMDGVTAIQKVLDEVGIADRFQNAELRNSSYLLTEVNGIQLQIRIADHTKRLGPKDDASYVSHRPGWFEADIVTPEGIDVLSKRLREVFRTPSTPDETAAEKEVQNAGEVETQTPKGVPTYAQKKQIVLDHFGGMYEDVAASSPEQIYEQVPEVTPEDARQIHAEIKSEFEAEQEKTRNAPDPFVSIAKAEGQVDLRPTEEQKKAGNYKKGHVNLLGFDISIENPAGSVRSGVSKDGTKWSNLMNNTYGYFRRTEGKDGDQVDVFLGDNLDSDAVYVVDQVDPETGVFDEHKTMLGFNSVESARENYLANYEPGWKGLGSITKMSLEGFKEWLGNAKRTRKPVDGNVPVKAAPVEQKQPEDTRPVKKVKEKKGWPMSKADEARLSREPQSFEEGVLQFLLGGGRISMDDYYTHFGRNASERKKNIWMYAKSGIRLDKLNEVSVFESNPNLLAGIGTGAMDQANAFVEVLRGALGGKNDVRRALDEIQGKIDQANEDMPPPPQEDEAEIDYIDAGQVVDEEILPLEEEDQEILRIFELEINELGKTLDDLKNLAANDPDYFQVFPYGLNEKQFNELKSILNDTERQKQIIGLDHEVNQSESRSEGDNEVPGSTGTESRTDGESGGERGTEEPFGEFPIYEREIHAIEEWLPDSEHSDYISYEWDGQTLEIFKGRDDRIIELSRDQLIDEGVKFPEASAPTTSRPEFAGKIFEKPTEQEKSGIDQAREIVQQVRNLESPVEYLKDLTLPKEVESFFNSLKKSDVTKYTWSVYGKGFKPFNGHKINNFFDYVNHRNSNGPEGSILKEKGFDVNLVEKADANRIWFTNGVFLSKTTGNFKGDANHFYAGTQVNLRDVIYKKLMDLVSRGVITEEQAYEIEQEGSKREETRKPEFAGDIFEQPQGKEHKYQMLSRPFDIGTYPKEGFIRSENDPNGGFQILAYDRKLPVKEWSKWDFQPTSDIEQIEGKEFTDKDGEYSRISLEWTGNKRFATVSMYDTNGDLVEEPFSMSIKDIMQNIEMGYWIEKITNESTPSAAESIAEVSTVKAIWQMTKQDFVYSPLRYDTMPTTDGSGIFRAEENADGTWNAWVEFPDGKRDYWTRGGSAGEAWDGGKRKTAYMNQEADAKSMDRHREAVIHALNEGKEVPEDVLRNYIGLKDYLEKQKKKEAAKPKEKESPIPAKYREQVDNLKVLVNKESEGLDTNRRIADINALEAPTKGQIKERNQLRLILDNTRAEIARRNDKVDYNIIPENKVREIRKLIEEARAQDEAIGQRILRLQDERDAKEKSLQKRAGLFGDRKEEEERKSGMQPMFAGEIFEATSDNLQAALKPFNDAIKKAEEEWKRNAQLLDEKIALVLSGAQMEIEMEPPAEPATTKPIDKESLPKHEDFGEKIGGARKDMGITRTVRDTDALPAWRRKYFYANVSGEMNLGDPTIDTSKPFLVKWSKEVKSWSGTRTMDYPVTTIDTREPKIFNSEAEAEGYIPIYEVWKQGFRIRKKEDNYVVTKTSSTGKVIEYATFPTEEEATTYMYSTEGATSLLNHKREDFSIPALDKVERTGKDWRKGKDVSTDEFMKTFGFRGGEFGNWVKPEERRVMLNAAYDSFMDLAEILKIPPKAISLNGELSIAFGARGTKGAAAHFEPDRAVINLTRMNGAGSLAHEWAHALDNYFGLQAAKKDYARNEEGELKAGRVMRTTADLLSKRGMRRELSEIFDAILKATQEKSVTRVMGIDEKQKAYDGQIKRVKDEAETLIRKFENGVRRYKYNRKAKKHEEVIVKATADQIKRAQVIIDKIIEGKGTRPKWAHIPGSKGHLEYSYISPETMALEEVYKEVFGKSGLKRDGNGFYNLGYFADKAYAAREILDKALAGESETLSIPTDFLKTSKIFDRSRANPYWSTQIEMFARAFEYFIETKLEEQNIRADYLQYDKAPVYDAVYEMNPYPAGDERTALNELFQKFFDEVKTKEEGGRTTMFRTSTQVYYSPIEKALEAIKQNKATAKQWKAMLLNNGAKQAELDWMGWDDFAMIFGDTSDMERKHVQTWIDQNRVEIKDITLDDTKETSKLRSLELKAEAGRRAIDEIQEEIGFRPYRVAVTGEWVYRDDDSEIQNVPEEYIDDLDKADEAIQALHEFDEEHIDITGDYNLRGTKYGKYVLPGGKDYKELLLTMPDKTLPDDELVWKQNKQGLFAYFIRDKQVSGAFVQDTDEQRDIARATISKATVEGMKGNFKSSHWDEPNILAHVRFNTRTSEDGKNILFIEEIQSDWAQRGKKEGFKGSFDEQQFEKWYKTYQHSTDPSWDEFLKLPSKEQQLYKDAFQEEADQRGVVPNMPFKKTDQWAGLAIRRMIKYAVDEGFDAIAWTTGEQQAERYDLSKQVDRVEYEVRPGIYPGVKAYTLDVFNKAGIPVMREQGLDEEAIEARIGKEIAQKIVNGEGETKGDKKVLSGLDLKVGGHGMKAFYDNILPAIANKIGKKYNSKVGEENLPVESRYYAVNDTQTGKWEIHDTNGGVIETGLESMQDAYAQIVELNKRNVTKIHSLPVTDSMFNAFREGVPMFRRGEGPKPQYETGYDALARFLEQDEADDQRYEAKTRIESLSKELNTPVKAINNRNELPPRVQAQAKRIGVWENETMYGAWDEQTGTMYVLLDDLMKLGPQRATTEGIKTVLHEAVAHKGLPMLLGDRGYDNLVSEIYDSIPDDDLTLIRYQYGWTEDKRLIAEEYLGMMAEDNVNPSLFQRIVAKIRQLLRKYFKVAYSKNDVYSLLRASRKNLENAPEEERGFYRSRPQADNFDYAGEYVQAQGTYFRTRKAASVKRNSPLGKAAEAYMEKAAKRTGEETVQGIREYIQDLSLPIRRFEEELLRRGGKQDNTSKPYRDMSLSFGRQEKLYNDYFEGKMKPILQAVADIKRAGIPGEDILPYIIAKHAMERNPAFRSRELKEWVESHKENVPQDEVNAKMEELKDKDYSGVMGFDTDKTYTNPDELARDIVSEFEGKVDAKLINNLWNKIGAATSEILDTWQRGHQITPEQKQEYLSQFRYFVPLRGWREGAAKELVYTKGEGFSRSLQYAKGRKSLADNPLAYLLNVQFQAIAEQVDNEVKTSMVNLIIKNLSNNEMHEMATIKKLYYVKITLPDGTEEWEPTIARPPQEMFDSGDAKTKIYSEHERLRKPRQAREHEVYVRKPGGDMVMVFNGKYLSTAQAMNKQNYMYRTIFGNIYDARDLNKVMALMGHMNNMLKALYTSWNVVFPFTNFMRDFQEASITQQIKSKSGGKVIKNYRAAFPAIIRRIQGKQDLKNPMDQQLEDFYNLGGATGYTHMKSPEEIEEDINKEVARMVRKGSIAGGIGDAGHALFAAVEHWNKIFEDATRFSVYLSSLAIGSTKEDAAIDAKEASVNFNRKGKGSKAWDAWFAFFNVAVQSMQKNFKLAKDTPKRFTQIAFSFVMLGFLEAMMNALTDDEDDPDSSYYNLNPYMRQNYLVIPLPKIGDLGKKSNKYLSVPLPQFWRGFKSIGSIAFDVATGRMKAGEAVTTALGNFAGGLLPIDVGGFYKSGEFSIAPLVPTITKPVVELIENRNYMGYTIKKEPFTREQKKYLANAGLGKDNVNPAAKFFTDLLFRWSGGDSRYKYYTDKQGRTRKVLLDVNPSTVEHLFKGYTGGTGGVFSDLLTTVSQAFDKEEEVDFRNVPFVDRFIRKTPEAKWSIISEYYDLKEDDDRDVALMKEYEKKGRETGDVSQYSRMATDEYRVMRRQLFDTYEDRISDLTKTATKDDMETADLVIEMMDRCIGQVKELEARYRRKY